MCGIAYILNHFPEMTGKIYISKGNPQDVLRNAVAERKERFDHSSKRFLSCVEVAENGCVYSTLPNKT